MTRGEAIKRINDGMGFRADGHSLEAKFILRLLEAQRDLEKGKTLPKFLLQEDQPLTLLPNTSTVAIPTGFLRDDDDNHIHFTPVGTSRPVFLERKPYESAVVANMRLQEGKRAPSIYVIRKATIDFIATADKTYNLTWNFYKAGLILTTDIENEWLANASDWLIGEAGHRIAMGVRDKEGTDLFYVFRTKGWAAGFWGDLGF